MVLTALAGGEPVEIERSVLDGCAVDGETMMVRLDVTVDTDAPSEFILRETLPEGWQIEESIWEGNRIDFNRHSGNTYRWLFGLNSSVSSGTLVYEASVRQNTDRRESLSGSALFLVDGVEETRVTGGDTGVNAFKDRGSFGLELRGEADFRINATNIAMTAEEVAHLGCRSESRFFELSLWAFEQAFTGGELNGYRLGKYQVESPLRGGASLRNVERTVAYNAPPEGVYHVALILSELVDGQEVVRDHRSTGDPVPLGGAAPWFAGAAEIDAGWHYFDWFKAFKPVGNGWIYHARHGWLFVKADGPGDLFLWDAAINRWFWTSETVYPWMYLFGPDGGWFFFFENGRPGTRFFGAAESEEVVSETELRR